MTSAGVSEKAKVLPTIFRGEYVKVGELGRKSRGNHGLATEDTIIEVIGDQRAVEEAVFYCRKKGICGLDLETAGLNHWTDKTVLCQIGDFDRQYLIWVDTVDMSPVWDLVTDEKIAKVGLNLKFDLKQMLVHYGLHIHAANVVDVQLIEQVINCGLFSEDDDSVGAALKMTGMAETAKRWLGLDLPKDEELRTGWERLTPGEWWEDRPDDNGVMKRHSLLAKKFYAADDVIVPLMILQRQKPWIVRLGLVQTVNLEHAFLPVLAEMEVRGVLLDMGKWLKLAEEAEKSVKEAMRSLDKLFDVTVTIEIDEDGVAYYTRDKKYTSPQQLKELVRTFMWQEQGIDVILTNRHLRESLERAEVLPERIAKLWVDAAKEAERLYKKSGKKKEKKTFGAANSNDLVPILWKKVSRHLSKKAFFIPNTESKTFKLYRVIGRTPDELVDSELPTRVGMPEILVDPIVDLRRFSKSAGTYGRNWVKLVNAQTGRLHFNFFQAALTTGRISSTPNAQNFPAGGAYRECFIPAEGYNYVGADWSQIEPRIIAELSQDPTYMRVFWSEFPGTKGFERWCDKSVTETLDLYTEIGKMVGVIPKHFQLCDVKGDLAKDEGVKGRKQAKIIVLGLGYGTGIPKFWITLIIDTKEHHPKSYAARLFEAFWSAVQRVKAQLDKFSELTNPEESKRRILHPYTQCELTWSETIGGRKRFYKPDSFKWWTTGRNHPIQGTGADIMKKAAVIFARWCWANDIDGGLVNLIHDELLAEIAKHQADVAMVKMQEIMQSVGESYCPSVPITASAYVDNFWKKD
jgi:DNA polymerase I-like protein with 3'-5' exonuclease and polymerase domains